MIIWLQFIIRKKSQLINEWILTTRDINIGDQLNNSTIFKYKKTVLLNVESFNIPKYSILSSVVVKLSTNYKRCLSTGYINLIWHWVRITRRRLHSGFNSNDLKSNYVLYRIRFFAHQTVPNYLFCNTTFSTRIHNTLRIRNNPKCVSCSYLDHCWCYDWKTIYGIVVLVI